jgi:hypothetical protein
VGHTQQAEIGGKVYTVRTRSMAPLLYEVPGFLTPSECAALVVAAQEAGIEESLTTGMSNEGGASGMWPHAQPPSFNEFDMDRDGSITKTELKRGLINLLDAPGMRGADFDAALAALALAPDPGTGLISEDAYDAASWRELGGFIARLRKAGPEKFGRYSNQTWLGQGEGGEGGEGDRGDVTDPAGDDYDVTAAVRARIAALLQLPRAAVAAGDQLQVVSYLPGGHYSPHHDSTDDMASESAARAITVLMHLSHANEVRVFSVTVLMHMAHVPRERGEGKARAEGKTHSPPAPVPRERGATEDERHMHRSHLPPLHPHCTLTAPSLRALHSPRPPSPRCRGGARGSRSQAPRPRAGRRRSGRRTCS